jgi:hypothetical protein
MPDDLKNPKDYEIDLGGGRRQILPGHPQYCQIKERHEPHQFKYQYIGYTNTPWNGEYYCDGISRWDLQMTDEIPDSLDDVMQVIELGGAIGRYASTACKQGQHDLCDEYISHPDNDRCGCRCHE